MVRLTIAAALITLQAGPLWAAPVTMSCDVASSTDRAHPFTRVNQIVVDVAENTVDLRVAQTIGTNEPVNWLFQTRTGVLGDDTFTIKQSGTFVYGAGIYGAAAHSFMLGDGGALSWTSLWEGKVTTIQWLCSR